MRALACLALAPLLLSVRAARAQPPVPQTLYAAGDIAFCVLNNPTGRLLRPPPGSLGMRFRTTPTPL